MLCLALAACQKPPPLQVSMLTGEGCNRQAFPFSPIEPGQRAEPRHVLLPRTPTGPGSLLRRADPSGLENTNSAVQVQYQSAKQDLRQQVTPQPAIHAHEQHPHDSSRCSPVS